MHHFSTLSDDMHCFSNQPQCLPYGLHTMSELATARKRYAMSGVDTGTTDFLKWPGLPRTVNVLAALYHFSTNDAPTSSAHVGNSYTDGYGKVQNLISEGDNERGDRLMTYRCTTSPLPLSRSQQISLLVSTLTVSRPCRRRCRRSG